MTRHDFYELAIETLLPADTPDYWAEYRAGTHPFRGPAAILRRHRGNEDEVLAVVRQMELDPHIPAAVEAALAGWRVVVTSAGCEWYIRQLLAARGGGR